LAQRLHRVKPEKPQTITWISLHEQFGQGFARVRDFRRQFLQTLQQVKAAYPNARLSATEVGLILENSLPPVPKKYTSGIASASSSSALRGNGGNLVAPPTIDSARDSATEISEGEGESLLDNPLNSRPVATAS